MKHLFLIFVFSASLLNALELDLSRGRLRNSKGRMEGNKITAVSPSRSAEILFDFKDGKDFSPFNRIRVELTPLEGKFIKRNFVLSFFSGKEIARFRPLNAPGGLLIENNKKAVLEYAVETDLKKVNALRLFFNRTEDSANRTFLLHKIEFYKKFTPRSMSAFRHKINTKTCALLSDDDRGHTAEEARFEKFGLRKQPRPTPAAALPQPDKISGRGRAEKKSIPVEILNETAFDRSTQLRVGVPFAENEVFSLKNLLLKDEKGQAVPAVFSVFSRYGNNSLRHLFVTAPIRLRPNEKKTYQLFYGNKVTAIPVKKAMTHSLKNGVLTVDNGRLKARISRKNFNFLRDLTLDGKAAGKFLPLQITMADGKKYTLADPESFELIEASPLRVTLRAAGKYTGMAGSYVCRITFKHNMPSFDIEFTHINTVLDWEFTDYKSLCLRFAPQEKIKNTERIFQETDKEYSRNGGPKISGRLSGAFRFTDRFGAAVADWWQRYPKAVSGKKGEVVIELLPEQPDKKFNTHLPLKLSYLYTAGNYRMKWGMSFTERITFDFSGASPEKLAAERQKPLIAVLPFDYYRKAGFVPDDPNLAPVDAAITDTFNRYIARQENEREYGFFNYGDSFGERGHSWTNNEYDPVHSVLKTYLRTGNRDMLRYGIVSARHQADVDTCHAYPNDYFVGANLQHSVGHSGVGRRWSRTFTRYTAAGNGHSWLRGRLLVWLLTGDTLVMDSCYLFGDHTAFAAVPNYKTILGYPPRETGWMLRGLTALYTVTRRPEYFKAAKTLADLAVKECAYDKGAWPRVIRRLDASFKEKTLGNNNFQVGVMLRGLCDYYRIDPDPAVKRAIISSARWLAKGFNPGNSAGFNYDIDINGRGLNWPVSQVNPLIAPSLAEAALLADDPALFAVAQRAFARILLGRHPIKHKTFALEWTFLHDYLRVEALWNKKHGKKSDYSRRNQLKIFYADTIPQWRIRGNSRWEIISCTRDAKISLRRWIRSGNPTAPVRLVLRDPQGRTVWQKNLPPNLLRQDIPLPLPGKKGTRFTLEITDSFNGDWSMGEGSQAVYAVRMTAEGIPVAHNGLHRFFAEIPAGKAVEVVYAGSHEGEWEIFLQDGEKLYRKGAFAPVISLHKFREDAARFKLPVSNRKRVIYMDCFSGTDARILVKGVDLITADKRFFKK